MSSFGFTRLAEADGDRSHSSLRQGSVQLVVTFGSATEEFLDAHGDGVADIAFACDSVPETFRQAVAARASVVRAAPLEPVVSGFGGTCHSLVARSAEPSLPAGRSWVPSAVVPPGPQGRVKVLDHVAVCVEGGTLAPTWPRRSARRYRAGVPVRSMWCLITPTQPGRPCVCPSVRSCCTWPPSTTS
jgi:4-hydroxymandelate synthase